LGERHDYLDLTADERSVGPPASQRDDRGQLSTYMGREVPPTTPLGCLNTQRGTIHEPRVTVGDVTTDHCPDDNSILGTASPDK